MKREAGASPARTRHRDSRAVLSYPLGNREGKGIRLIDQPGDLPFAVQNEEFMSRGTDSTKHLMR